MTSARMKPFSKSVWITAAAWGAVSPFAMVQARTSFTPGGEIGLQAEQLVGSADQTVQPRFFQVQVGQKNLLVLVRHLRDFGFQCRADRHDRRTLAGGILLHSLKQRIILETLFINVGNVNRRFGG